MKLIPVGRLGELPEEMTLDEYFQVILEMTVRHTEQSGYVPPWISYFAIGDLGPVGSCAFKSAPVAGRVEIAYGTKPGYEGQGIATAMATELVNIAQRESPSILVFAQTLPEENASTSILKKLGFVRTGCIEHSEDGTVWEWELRRDECKLESGSGPSC